MRGPQEAHLDSRTGGEAGDTPDRSGAVPAPGPDREIRLIPLASYDSYEVANAVLEEDSEAGLSVEGEVWREALEAVYRRLRGDLRCVRTFRGQARDHERDVGEGLG